jgi:hypothetical protein
MIGAQLPITSWCDRIVRNGDQQQVLLLLKNYYFSFKFGWQGHGCGLSAHEIGIVCWSGPSEKSVLRSGFPPERE